MGAPEKTGAVIYSVEYGCYFVTDAFKFGDVYIFNVGNQRRFKKLEPQEVYHYEVTKIAHWFNEGSLFGYMVALAADVTYMGYEGISP